MLKGIMFLIIIIVLLFLNNIKKTYICEGGYKSKYKSDLITVDPNSLVDFNGYIVLKEIVDSLENIDTKDLNVGFSLNPEDTYLVEIPFVKKDIPYIKKKYTTSYNFAVEKIETIKINEFNRVYWQQTDLILTHFFILTLMMRIRDNINYTWYITEVLLLFHYMLTNKKLDFDIQSYQYKTLMKLLLSGNLYKQPELIILNDKSNSLEYELENFIFDTNSYIRNGNREFLVKNPYKKELRQRLKRGKKIYKKYNNVLNEKLKSNLYCSINRIKNILLS